MELSAQQYKAYQEAVKALASITGIDALVRQANSSRPHEVFNALVATSTFVGARTIGSVDSTAMMLAQVETLLATAPEEDVEAVRESASRSHRVATQLDGEGAEGARG